IPVADGAPLFALLERTFATLQLPSEHFLARLVRSAIRPLVIHRDDEAPAPLQRGVPTGSPIQPSICNLYLTSLDEALSAIPGAFYARFGDDLLFAHPDPDVARSASDTIEAEITRLGLSLKAEKKRDYYFTAAGRPHPNWTGAQYVEYLGVRVDFGGAIGLTRAKARRLQHALSQRVDNAVRLANPQPKEALAIAAHVTARTLDVRLTISDPLLGLLYHAVDDRAQLRHLDYLFARKLAQRLSRKRGVRAFRSCTYKALRRAGVPSLVHLKNLALR
ncbi:MAG TPA: reverse transcriptase domain-containing protein, partial [Polyangiales bacterium]|nr:reverse transcriptase domain-containing protein [Polyangiales bacterium]